MLFLRCSPRLGLSGHFTHLRGDWRDRELRAARTGISRTCVCVPHVEMAIESTRATIEAVERTDGFAHFGVRRASDFVRKHELSGPLDDSLRGDRVVGADQPYWHTPLEEIVTYFRVWCKTTHPVGLDRKRGAARVGNTRLDVHNIVKERQNVEAVPLSLSHKDDDVMKGKRMVEEQHDIVFQRLEHSAGDVLLVPTCVLPFFIVV